MKITAMAEQYDGGREVHVQQEGPHVLLSVEAQQGANAGVGLLTPGQARTLAGRLLRTADECDESCKTEGIVTVS
jgi:hypothetical protein